jgi:hypothetical protein
VTDLAGERAEWRSEESVRPMSELTSKPPLGRDVADELLVVSPFLVDDEVLPGS